MKFGKCTALLMSVVLCISAPFTALAASSSKMEVKLGEVAYFDRMAQVDNSASNKNSQAYYEKEKSDLDSSLEEQYGSYSVISYNGSYSGSSSGGTGSLTDKILETTMGTTSDLLGDYSTLKDMLPTSDRTYTNVMSGDEFLKLIEDQNNEVRKKYEEGKKDAQDKALDGNKEAAEKIAELMELIMSGINPYTGTDTNTYIEDNAVDYDFEQMLKDTYGEAAETLAKMLDWMTEQGLDASDENMKEFMELLEGIIQEYMDQTIADLIADIDKMLEEGDWNAADLRDADPSTYENDTIFFDPDAIQTEYIFVQNGGTYVNECQTISTLDRNDTFYGEFDENGNLIGISYAVCCICGEKYYEGQECGCSGGAKVFIRASDYGGTDSYTKAGISASEDSSGSSSSTDSGTLPVGGVLSYNWASDAFNTLLSGDFESTVAMQSLMQDLGIDKSVSDMSLDELEAVLLDIQENYDGRYTDEEIYDIMLEFEIQYMSKSLDIEDVDALTEEQYAAMAESISQAMAEGFDGTLEGMSAVAAALAGDSEGNSNIWTEEDTYSLYDLMMEFYYNGGLSEDSSQALYDVVGSLFGYDVQSYTSETLDTDIPARFESDLSGSTYDLIDYANTEEYKEKFAGYNDDTASEEERNALHTAAAEWAETRQIDADTAATFLANSGLTFAEHISCSQEGYIEMSDEGLSRDVQLGDHLYQCSTCGKTYGSNGPNDFDIAACDCGKTMLVVQYADYEGIKIHCANCGCDYGFHQKCECVIPKCLDGELMDSLEYTLKSFFNGGVGSFSVDANGNSTMVCAECKAEITLNDLWNTEITTKNRWLCSSCASKLTDYDETLATSENERFWGEKQYLQEDVNSAIDDSMSELLRETGGYSWTRSGSDFIVYDKQGKQIATYSYEEVYQCTKYDKNLEAALVRDLENEGYTVEIDDDGNYTVYVGSGHLLDNGTNGNAMIIDGEVVDSWVFTSYTLNPLELLLYSSGVEEEYHNSAIRVCNPGLFVDNDLNAYEDISGFFDKYLDYKLPENPTLDDFLDMYQELRNVFGEYLDAPELEKEENEELWTEDDLKIFDDALQEYLETGKLSDDMINAVCEKMGLNPDDYKIETKVQANTEEKEQYLEDFKDSAEYKGTWDAVFGGWPADQELWTPEMWDVYNQIMYNYQNDEDFKSTYDSILEEAQKMQDSGALSGGITPEVVESLAKQIVNGFSSINDSVILITNVDVNEDIDVVETGYYYSYGPTIYTITDEDGNKVAQPDDRVSSTIAWFPTATGKYTAKGTQTRSRIDWTIGTYNTVVSCWIQYPNESEPELVSSFEVKRQATDIPGVTELQNTSAATVTNGPTYKVTVVENDYDINQLDFFATERVN